MATPKKAPIESPTAEGLPPSPVEQQVARVIRRLREESNLTLRQLGQMSGLSESYLSRVENFKCAINLANLARIAEAFVMPVGVFFEQETSPTPYVVRRAGKGRKIKLRGNKGVDVQLLAHDMPLRMMEPFIVDVASAHPQQPIQQHNGQEFVYILEGSCRFLIAGESLVLQTGDAIYFEASVPHRVEPIQGVPCKSLAVVTAKDYHFHNNISRLLNE